ncbi:MAG: DNA primase [bacterium]
MQDQVEEIKNRLSIVDVIEEYIPLKKAGHTLKTLCPFHQEKTPSFVVNPDIGIFKCFGCNESGDMFAFVMKKEHLTFKEALEKLARKAGVTLTKDVTQLRKIDRKESAYRLNKRVTDYYNRILMQESAKPAREYLHQRGFTDEMIQTAQLGLAPNAWDTLSKKLKQSPKQQELATELGLLQHKNDRHYDRFRGRIMFPIFNGQNAVVGFSGRSLDFLLNTEEQANSAKYMNSPQSVVFDKSSVLYGMNRAKESIIKEKSAILVEGNVDVLLLHQEGTLNALAPLGTSLTEQHLRIIKHWTENVILAFDGDDAGKKATLRALELLGSLDFSSWVVALPKNYDVAQWIQEGKTWKELEETKVEGPLFYILNTESQHDSRTVNGKKETLQQLIPYLSNFSSPVVTTHYLRIVAHRFDIPEETLHQAIKAEKRKKKNPKRPIQTVELNAKDDNQLEKLLVKILSENLDQLTPIQNKIDPDFIANPICHEIISIIKDRQSLQIKELIHSAPEEVRAIWQDFLLDERLDTRVEDEDVQAAIAQLLARVKEQHTNRLQRKIRQINNPEESSQLLQNMLELIKDSSNKKR